MNLAVIGSGYVGLVTGACFADLGHDVICVDHDEDKVRGLAAGVVPIYEPGLGDVVERGIAAARLSFTTGLPEAVAGSEVVFICVPTPSAEDGSADLSHVESVAAALAPAISDFALVVNKSTIPVGSSRRVERIVRDGLHPGAEFEVASNPEFLREGSAVFDFMHPDRIVVGTDSERAAGILTELYRPLGVPILVTDPASAEMIKYASNAFLATKISFINAMANVCEAVGADVRDVALGMGYDSRIGFEFLRPGPGFGGSCLPKDCRALVRVADANGYDFHLLRGVLRVNEAQHRLVAAKADRLLGGLKGRRLAVWGLTFKPNTDDVRDSPALAVVGDLVAAGAHVRAYDPVAPIHAVPPGVERASSPIEAAEGADAVLLLTEWDEFRWLDFERLHTLMARPVIVDVRNALDPPSLRRLGFVYEGVGR